MNVKPQSPLVSVGLVVRNCAVPLHQALRSILLQSYGNWELIVIDDGSTDGTPDVVRRCEDSRIHLVCGETSWGLPARLNQAIALAKGKYFARMDGDDVSFPQRFERQVSFLESRPDIDLLGTGAVVFQGDGEILGLRPVPVTHEQICAKPRAGFYLAHPSWMGRLDWFRQHSYDVRARKAQDYDLLLRTYAHSRYAALPEPLLGYREEILSRKKNLATRRQILVSQWRQAHAGADFWQLALSVGEQCAKAVVELAVIGTPIERKVLAHRALPIDSATVAAWKLFWQQITGDEFYRGKCKKASCAD